MDSQQTPQPTAPVENNPVAEAQPQTGVPQRDKGMEMILPVNRSGWSIAAGYVALFNLPFIFFAPIGVILGIIALRDIKKNPQRAGRGRAWFAIIYGFVSMAALILLLSSLRR